MPSKLWLVPAIVFSAVLAYAIPSWVEFSLIRHHASASVVTVLIGDLPGCVVLAMLGWRRMAAVIYASAVVLKSLVIAAGIVPAQQVVWAADALPAFCLAFVFGTIALRGLIPEE